MNQKDGNLEIYTSLESAPRDLDKVASWYIAQQSLPSTFKWSKQHQRVKRQDERLGLHLRGIEVEGNSLTLEFRLIKMNETLKILGLGCNIHHVVTPFMSCRGDHPKYTFFIWHTTSWHPSCHIMTYGFPKKPCLWLLYNTNWSILGNECYMVSLFTILYWMLNCFCDIYMNDCG